MRQNSCRNDVLQKVLVCDVEGATVKSDDTARIRLPNLANPQSPLSEFPFFVSDRYFHFHHFQILRASFTYQFTCSRREFYSDFLLSKPWIGPPVKHSSETIKEHFGDALRHEIPLGINVTRNLEPCLERLRALQEWWRKSPMKNVSQQHRKIFVIRFQGSAPKI